MNCSKEIRSDSESDSDSGLNDDDDYYTDEELEIQTSK